MNSFGWSGDERKCESPAGGAKQCPQVQVCRTSCSMPCTRKEFTLSCTKESFPGRSRCQENLQCPDVAS